MRAQQITTDFHRFGLMASVIWTTPAAISLAISLYGCLTSDHIDEYDLMLAIVGMLGMGFAVGSYAIALALDRIAIGLSLAVAEQLARTALSV